jgi:hypothetical protein
VKKGASVCARTEPYRVVLVGDTCVSEQGVATPLGHDKRYHVCIAHDFSNGGELIRKAQQGVIASTPPMHTIYRVPYSAVCLGDWAFVKLAPQVTDELSQPDEGIR